MDIAQCLVTSFILLAMNSQAICTKVKMFLPKSNIASSIHGFTSLYWNRHTEWLTLICFYHLGMHLATYNHVHGTDTLILLCFTYYYFYHYIIINLLCCTKCLNIIISEANSFPRCFLFLPCSQNTMIEGAIFKNNLANTKDYALMLGRNSVHFYYFHFNKYSYICKV